MIQDSFVSAPSNLSSTRVLAAVALWFGAGAIVVYPTLNTLVMRTRAATGRRTLRSVIALCPNPLPIRGGGSNSQTHCERESEDQSFHHTFSFNNDRKSGATR